MYVCIYIYIHIHTCARRAKPEVMIAPGLPACKRYLLQLSPCARAPARWFLPILVVYYEQGVEY